MPLKTFKCIICGRTTNSISHPDRDNSSRSKCTSPSGKHRWIQKR